MVSFNWSIDFEGMGLDGRGFIGFGRAKTFKGFSKGERFWVFRGISLFPETFIYRFFV
jgi:hypothetical protein